MTLEIIRNQVLQLWQKKKKKKINTENLAYVYSAGDQRTKESFHNYS